MEKEPKDPEEHTHELDNLKRIVANLEREIAELRRDPVAHEEVEQAFREWEQKYGDEMAPNDCDPTLREFLKALHLLSPA